MTFRRFGKNGQIWPDDRTKVCAICGLGREMHLFGLYTAYCPDEKQPDMLPNGRWKPGATVKTYHPIELSQDTSK